MSQRRTAGGEKRQASERLHRAIIRHPSVARSNSGHGRESAMSPGHEEVPARLRQEQRSSRGPGVHAILNPSASSHAQPESSAATSRPISSSARVAASPENASTFREDRAAISRRSTALPPSESHSTQHGHGFSHSQPPRESRRRGGPAISSPVTEQPSVSHPPAEYRSPSATVSGAPFSYEGSRPLQHFTGSLQPQLPPTNTSVGGGGDQTVLDRPPVSSLPGSNTSSFQYMTLETEHGPVSFPVDVRAASRVADEKRRRNAGASARFRARRKEKEHANVREVEELREQIRDLEEDADFYRAERDYLVQSMHNTPGGERHFPRPLSPRHTRVERRQAEGTSFDSFSGHESAYQEYGEREAPEGRYTRRRLSPTGYEGDWAERFQPTLPPRSSLLPPVQTFSTGPTMTEYQPSRQQADRSITEQRLYRPRLPSPPSEPAPAPEQPSERRGLERPRYHRGRAGRPP